MVLHTKFPLNGWVTVEQGQWWAQAVEKDEQFAEEFDNIMSLVVKAERIETPNMTDDIGKQLLGINPATDPHSDLQWRLYDPTTENVPEPLPPALNVNDTVFTGKELGEGNGSGDDSDDDSDDNDYVDESNENEGSNDESSPEDSDEGSDDKLGSGEDIRSGDLESGEGRDTGSEEGCGSPMVIDD